METPVRWKVRICLAAFRDAHMLIPRLAGRAQLRRQALKLQWWIRDERLFDMSVCSIPDVPMWELVVEEGYGFGDGFRVVFAMLEPDETIWVLVDHETGRADNRADKADVSGAS